MTRGGWQDGAAGSAGASGHTCLGAWAWLQRTGTCDPELLWGSEDLWVVLNPSAPNRRHSTGEAERGCLQLLSQLAVPAGSIVGPPRVSATPPRVRSAYSAI